jgi:hypothetical protein
MSITKKNAVTITVQRKTRSSDGAGGYTVTRSAVTGSPFTGRLIRKQPLALAKASPGDLQVAELVLVFPAGPDIRVDDICTISGTEYVVQGVRSYTRSVQADVKSVG